MQLTGKCKEEFREYLLNGIVDASYAYRHFITLPKSMRYGVLEDYFDSVGVIIEIKIQTNLRYNYGIHDKIEWLFYSRFFSDRNLAKDASVEKANELRNEVLNK
tara:strand:+ start:531 stop:842 length:312 start_codon:yes stop_codon:yes gene_type:complete